MAYISDKRRIQSAFLPHIINQVLELVVIDTEHAPHYCTWDIIDECEANLPALKTARDKALQVVEEIIPDKVVPHQPISAIARRLQREYMDEFQIPLVKRTTGYGFLCCVYLSHRYMEAGINLDDRILEAVNAVSEIAQSGTNKDAIDGMGKSAWKMSGKLFDRFVFRELI